MSAEVSQPKPHSDSVGADKVGALPGSTSVAATYVKSAAASGGAGARRIHDQLFADYDDDLVDDDVLDSLTAEL
jgi:hypothetical protein